MSQAAGWQISPLNFVGKHSYRTSQTTQAPLTKIEQTTPEGTIHTVLDVNSLAEQHGSGIAVGQASSWPHTLSALILGLFFMP